MPRADRPPSFQFYPADYLADPAVAGMTFDERGRYWWALCWSWQTRTPGSASEEQWRRWMAYTDAEWPLHREALALAFRVQTDGTWLQKRTVQTRIIQRRLRAQASRGGEARKQKLSPERRSEIARQGALSLHSKQGGQAGLLTPSSSSSSSSSGSTHTQKHEHDGVAPDGAATSGEPNGNGTPDDRPLDPTSDEVDQFVAAYPKPTTRRAAARAFGQAVRRHRHDNVQGEPNPWTAAQIIEAARYYARQVECDKTEKQFIPGAARWLDEDGFETATKRHDGYDEDADEEAEWDPRL